jgi:tetratricopeptide (TPR) repeat protein
MYAYLAERIAARRLPPDVFLLVTALDRPELSPEEKSSLASQGIAGTNLSFFHGVLGDAYRELGRFVQARTTYRHALELAEEPDIKTQLLVKLGGVVEDPVERVSLFAEAIELSGNATAVAAARLSLLRMPRA